MNSACEREHLARSVMSLEAPSRKLWQPDRNSQIAAMEILLASPLPHELRSHLRDRFETLTERDQAA